ASMKKFTLFLCLTAILMTGCAQTIAGFNAERQRAEWADARQRCESLMADPALNPIRDKVALFNTEQQTFAMRTNTDYVSSEEKSAIALWAQKRDQCQLIERPMWDKAPVQLAAVSNAAKQLTDSMIAELYLGRITYGELANRRAKNAAE